MMIISFFTLFYLLPACSQVVAFQGLSSTKILRSKFGVPSDTRLAMAVTPIGPFCPFRSSLAVQMDTRMEQVTAASPILAREMEEIMSTMQTGQLPDPDRLLKAADEIDAGVDQWETLTTRLRLSQDFQSREYAKMTQSHLESSGLSVSSMGSMMRWQAEGMRAMARNTSPPMPPPDVDLTQMMNMQNPDQRPPSIASMTAAEGITANPFTGKERSFDSPVVKEEYEKLCRDHQALIDFGTRYGTFDPLGKILFIDEVEKIEERWDIFFARFSLMGELNEEYVRQCNEFLNSMGLTEEEYRNLLKKAHELLRADAEEERNRL